MTNRSLASNPFLLAVCLVVCYSMLFSAWSPLRISNAGAITPTKKQPPMAPVRAMQGGRRDGELLVRFRSSVSEGMKTALAASRGMRRAGRLRGGSRIERWALSPGQEPAVAAVALTGDPAVEFAEPNLLITADGQTYGQRFPGENSLLSRPTLNPNQRRPTPANQTVRGPLAASGNGLESRPISIGGQEPAPPEVTAVIAVIDSGIDFTHPDLVRTEWVNAREISNGFDDDRDGLVDDLQGWDFVTDSNEIKDEQGHGTAIAGVVTAGFRSGIPVSGVPALVSLMSLRVLDASGTGDVAHAVEAIDYAMAHGAQVINLSWGTSQTSEALKDSIRRASRRGVVVVCSAGNLSKNVDNDPTFPSAFSLSNAVSVAATDSSDKLALFSNWGATSVAVGAPGVNILSTRMGGGYAPVTGTSIAVPVVSAEAGVIKTLRPFLSAERTKEVIVQGARPVAALTGKVASGGVVDLPRTLVAVNQLPAGEGLPRPPGNGSGTGNGSDSPDLTPLTGRNGEGPAGNFSVTPNPGRRTMPRSNLPNLDETRRATPTSPNAPPPIPSTLKRPGVALSEVEKHTYVLARANNPPSFDLIGALLGANWHDPNFTPATSFKQGLGISDSPFKLFPAAGNTRGYSAMPGPLPSCGGGQVPTDQFIQQFYSGALARQPNSRESLYWNGVLQQAYNQSQSLLLVRSQTLGRALFRSAEYAARNRTDHEFVYDLYWAYLQRAPDQGGWDFWTSQVTSYGRETGLVAFGTSIEFSNKVATLCPNGSTASDSDPTGNNFKVARLDPNNRIRGAGEDLLSRNYNWSLPLLGLAGRAGLNLSLSLTYNSLVWTKDGSFIGFDYDHGSPSPGFRLGFPTIQNWYYDDLSNHYAYLMVMPSGERVELRQVGTSTVYEAGDSSYFQLTESGSLLVVRTTNGTQLTYSSINGEYLCTQIKDRNGNYITVAYNGLGQISTITDTLARVVTFNYDGYNNLTSITQTWNGASHQWATFGWGNLTIQTGFSGLMQLGVQNNTTIPVLIQVGLADGMRYNFDYNSVGQVYKINHFASDNHLDNYTSYTLPGNSSDCPRISERRDWAENWNGNNEAVNTYTVDGGGAWGQVALPDNQTSYKEFFATSGWQRGLTTQTEVWFSGTRKKWTTTNWTQDDTNLAYQANPRPTESNVYDAEGNRRRSTVSYTSYGLPSDIYEYAADAATVLRRTHTDYNLDSAYISRRIIGLVSAQYLYDGSNNLFSKVDYQYDWTGEYLQNQGAPVQHDETNFSAGFVVGRGNLSSVRRWNVNSPNDSGQVVESKSGYNSAGDMIFTRDPLNHQATISYTDSFSDNTNHNTLAYPTTVTDGDNFSATSQYHYDMGVVTRTQDPKGAAVSRTYDTAGRLQQVTNLFNNAYQRFVYGSYYVQTFGTVNNVADDSYAIKVFDGAGRVTATASSHPGCTGGYRAQYAVFDVLGRAVQQSNPTEITAGWVPTGDDSAFIYTEQAYDWNDRPTLTTNHADGSTKEITYGGCGCAGGDVTTIRDEVGRRQRMTRDVLGRLVKTEVLNWDQSVYSTTTNAFNTRDQVTSSVLQQGTSGTSQTTTLTYDGHGRPATKQEPRETGACSYTYNADDTLNVKTDARGATATYTYNNRRQVTAINYTNPGSVWATPNVTFGYDEAGNRTSMTDGAGSVSYQYNTISKMTSETRVFTGFNSYTLNYSYNLAGELASMTDGLGGTVNYNYDSAARLNSMTTSGYNGGSTLASGISYRAWGAVKQASYADSNTLTTSYNARMQLTALHVGSVMNAAFQYYADGRLTYVQDQNSGIFDRSSSYDHVGRITEAKSGAEARGLATQDGPYKQNYAYDVWGNMTSRTGRLWSQPQPDYTGSFTNDRNGNWQYDASGNVTQDDTPYYPRQFKYDADGREVRMVDPTPNVYGITFTDTLDGDGVQVKRVRDGLDTFYEVRSTVLGGQKVAEIYFDNRILERDIYAQGKVIARQYQDAPLHVVYNNPLTGSESWSYPNIGYFQAYEFDPLGDDVGTYDPYLYGGGPSPDYPSYGDPTDFSFGCTLDGVGAACSEVARLVRIGAAGPELPRFKFTPYYEPYDRNRIPPSVLGGDNGSQALVMAYGFSSSPMFAPISIPDITVTVPISFDSEIDYDSAVGRLTLELMLRGIQSPTPTPQQSTAVTIPNALLKTPECLPQAVKDQFKSAWDKSQHGHQLQGAEFGFAINDNDRNGAYTPTDIVSTFEASQTNVPISAGSIAAVHTHNVDDLSGASIGDTKIATRNQIPVYVISQDGIYLYNPFDKSTQFSSLDLREGLDHDRNYGLKVGSVSGKDAVWKKPCRKH